MAKLKVAVVGSGASGLTSIKCCVDEGLEPVCFEQEDYIGGMWKFTEENSRSSSVYRSTVINTSKEMMCFSDFPMPEDFPPYSHNTYVMKYFDLYAKRFGLEKYIRFGRKVVSIKQAEDYETSGKWIVSTSCGAKEEDDVDVEEFDAVMVCTGHHWQPSWPSFKGMDIFQGVQMHSHSYKDFRGFEGKTVLVIGIGNSGGDIAVELSRHAKQVYLSTRRGAWIVSRLADHGLPTDFAFGTRFFNLVPTGVARLAVERICNQWFCHTTFALRPSHPVTAQHPMVNDALPHQIITGALVVKPNVEEFFSNGVKFDDGSVVNEIDVVIFCTGYDMRFAFLEIESDIICENQVNLYKYVFPPFLKKSNLAVIGNIQPIGAVNPISELQARWACGLFQKKYKLPPQCEMESDISCRREQMKKRYYASKRHTVQVDYIPYCDELAEMIGCKPNLLKLFLTDPLLSLKCFFGPCTPSQYRLMGPGTWDGAKEAIEKARSRTTNATKTRVVDKPPGSVFANFFQYIAILVLITVILYKLL